METFEKFTWTINNFSKLDSNKLYIYSEKFILGDHTWQIIIYPKGNKVNSLSIYLDAGGGALANKLPSNWVKFAKFKLAVVNQVNVEMTRIQETEMKFNAKDPDWGFPEFMPLYELLDISKGFLVNDTCVIEAGIWVRNLKHKNKSEDTKNNDSMVPKELVNDEVVDFKGLGKIEKAFVPMLEDVCLRYPSLIDCHKKRSYRFTEWAFTALGRVLYFLKIKKVKDMKDDETCDQLQILWDELEMFKFDLTWLEPHIQSAFRMKSYTERAENLKKLKENVGALEIEVKTLKSNMIAKEVYLEIAKRELLKVEEGFEEKNSDAELGYGGPYIDLI